MVSGLLPFYPGERGMHMLVHELTQEHTQLHFLNDYFKEGEKNSYTSAYQSYVISKYPQRCQRNFFEDIFVLDEMRLVSFMTEECHNQITPICQKPQVLANLTAASVLLCQGYSKFLRFLIRELWIKCKSGRILIVLYFLNGINRILRDN